MPFKCCVPGCNGNYKNGPRVGLFSFPKDKTLRSKWISAIGGNDFKPAKTSKVCQLHFAEEDLIRVSSQKDSVTGQIYSVGLKYARRREGSIPQLFPAKLDCGPQELFDEATNTVDSILKAGKLSKDNQLKIKLLGRPTPVLSMEYTEEAESQNSKSFSKEIYNNHYWICGCPIRNALFCFPCILFFQKSVDSIWNTVGETDLINMQESINKHKTSKNHLSACVYLSMLGRRRLYQLNPSEKQEIARHNQTVAQNRQVLSKVINWLKFRATFAIETGTHNEKYIFNNDIFKDIIDYNSDLDNLLKSSKSTLFKGSSKDFQNEILYCMEAVCQEEICTQISEAEFLAIECNETNNIGNECELGLTLRYIYREKTVERFWCFFNVMDDTATFTSSIQAQLDHILKDNNDKLIAQSYKVSRILSEHIADVEVKMMEKYQASHVIHSYTNEMDLLLQSLPRRNGNFRIFFSKLFEFPRFFSKSKDRCDVVERIGKAKLTRIPPKSWTCNKQLVHIVFANQEELKLSLREISNECERVSIVRKAIALGKILNDPDFIFWLSYFDKLNPYIEVLLQHFQSKNTLNDEYRTKFDKWITMLRDVPGSLESPTVSKRRKLSETDVTFTVVNKACDDLINGIKDHLQERNYLLAELLLDNNSFENFDSKFPQRIFEPVAAFYSMLDKDKLKSELQSLYSIDYFKNENGAKNILKFIEEYNLKIFSEITKLCKIILTIPSNSEDNGRFFSTLKRVETFLNNTFPKETLSAHAMMALNKDLVHEISDFEDKVFEKFISVGQRGAHFLCLK